MKSAAVLRPQGLHKQRGIAALLLILLVGLGVLALSAAVLHNINNTQERQIAAHAQVNAQQAAWTTVENVRQYLLKLTPAQLTALAVNAQLNINNNADLSAKITSNTPPAAGSFEYRIGAQITAKDVAAKSASVVEVVYSVTPGQASGDVSLGGAMLKGDTTITGGMNYTGAGGNGLDFIVDGSLDIKSSGIDGAGLRNLTATGDISIDSAVKATTVFANGNVTVKQGAGVKNIYALGNVTTQGGANGIEVIRADKDITLGAAPVLSTVNARGNITVTGYGDSGILTAQGNVTLTASGGAAQINSRGNVEWSPNVNNKPTVLAWGDVTCKSGSLFTKIQAGGSINSCNSGNKTPNSIPPVTFLDPQDPFTNTPPIVDAWTMKSSANYAFEYKNSAMMVTVANVAGIANGEYAITNAATGAPEFANAYICSNGSASCTKPDRIYICNASDQSPCISYNTANSMWSLQGSNIAPGIAWFKGNITLSLSSKGTYFNSFIVTGDIYNSADTTVISPNFAGYNNLCVFNGSAKTLGSISPAETIDAKFSPSVFSSLIPTNFCDASAAMVTKNGVTYKPLKTNSLGNIALLAGGTNPSVTPLTYTGGNINLSYSNKIYGNILAGEQLNTSGDTTAFGFFIAADSKGDGGTNGLTAKLVINLKDLPPDFDNTKIPDMSGAASTPATKLLWSRYK